RCAPDVRVESGEAVVLGEYDAVRPAAGELGCDAVELCAEHEPDVVAPELAGKLAPLAEQLERVPRGPAAGKLDERPAVVALRRRLFAEPLGSLPAARVGRTLGGELADARRGGGEVCEPLAAAWRRDVPHREHASRGSRLAETLVVLVHLPDEVVCLPDVDASVSRPVRVPAVRERKQRGRFELPRLVAVVGLACRTQPAGDHLDRRDARQMRPAQECGRLGGNLPRLRVGAWDLFDEADDLHLWEPNEACWLSCTTSTATWSRSIKC